MRASSRLFFHLLLFAGLLFAGPSFGLAAHATEPGSGELRWRDASEIQRVSEKAGLNIEADP